MHVLSEPVTTLDAGLPRGLLVVCLSTLTMVFALGLLVTLSLTMLDGGYRDALLARYHFPARNLQLRIEHMLRADVNSNLSGADIETAAAETHRILLDEIRARDIGAAGRAAAGAGPISLFVVSPGGDILYSDVLEPLSGGVSKSFADARPTLDSPEAHGSKSFYFDSAGEYVIPVEIFGAHGQLVAHAIVLVDKDLIDARASKPLRQAIEELPLLVVLFVLIYVLTLIPVVRQGADGFSRKRFLWSGVTIGALSQIAVAVLIGSVYMGHFSDVSPDGVDLIVDGVATILVSLIVLLEMLLVLCLLVERRTARMHAPDVDHCGAMRPAIFLFLIGIDLCLSFIPLHMDHLYEPILGLSRDTVMALPISVEFLFVGIAILAGGIWFDRCHWRQPFTVGVILAGAGSLYSWLAPDALHFIASRAVLGTGYGLALLASKGFVFSHSDHRSQARAFARLFAGLYGGSICGSVAGAILAERMGYGPVFLIGGLIVFLVLPYVALALPRGATRSVVVTKPKARKQAGPSPVAGFLGNRSVLGLILFSSMPAAITAVGFLHYFSPIYLDRFGASQSTIGQVLMLYGLCLVFLGPWVSRNIDTARRKKLAVIAGGVLGGAAFISFNALQGLVGAIVAVLVLGIAHSLVFASQNAYALTLKATRDLGEGKALGIFRSTGRAGQMLGPMIFGLVVVAMGVEQGLTCLGIAYLVSALMFWLLTRNDRRMLAEEVG